MENVIENQTKTFQKELTSGIRKAITSIQERQKEESVDVD
jgi:hypothetical protein